MKRLMTSLTLLCIPCLAYGAISAGGLGGVLTSYHVTTAPNTPTGVTATPGDAQNTVTWSAGATDSSHDAATSFTLYGGTSASPTSSIYSGSGTSYTHTGLIGGTPYYYRLIASNSAGNSGYTSPDAVAIPYQTFTDAFTGSNGTAFSSAYWNAPFSSYQTTTAAGYTATIQSNKASFTVAASGASSYGSVLVSTVTSAPFVNGRYVQVDFTSGPAASNAYNRWYITGANTTYSAYGDPLTNFMYITYNSGGNINVCCYNSSSNTGEISFGGVYSGAQTVKVVLTDSTHFAVYVGGAQQGSTTATTISWGSSVASRLGLVTYGTTAKTYTFDNFSIQ